jgi:hypothetical protein
MKPLSRPCCNVCGDLPCRTVEVDGSTFETLPEDLIVKATMIAPSAMAGPPASAPSESSCCSTSCSCD